MEKGRPRRIPDLEPSSASYGLGVRLVGIVLLALLPALALLLFTSLELRRSAVANAKAEALRLATVAGENQARVIQGSRELLNALASLPAIRGGHDPERRRVLEDQLRTNRSYLNLGVADSTGLIVSSALPMQSPVDASNRSWFRRAWSTRDFAVGDYQIGRITLRPSLNVARPVRAEDGRVTGVIFAAIGLHTFAGLAARMDLPPGASLHVVDGAGVVLACYPDPGRWVGRNTAGEPATALMLSTRRGVFEARGLDGVQRLYGCTNLPNGGGYVAVGMPRAAARRAADDILARALLGLAAAALLALLAVWLLGRRLLLRPLAETMEGASRALRSMQTETERRRRILQAAVDQTEDPIAVVDAGGRLVHWNSALQRTYGYAPAELPLLHVWDLSSDLPPGAWREAWNTVREARTRRLQTSARRRDGTLFPADIRVTHITVGDTEYRCALIRDTTEWLATQRALAEQEARLRGILEHSSNLFYSHTPDHVLTYVSPQARAFLGCEPEEALRRWTEFVTENPVNQAGVEATQRAIDTGRRQPRYELELRTLQGRTLWVEVDEAPVVENGRTVAIVGALTNVTARKQAEAEQARLEDQLVHSRKMEAVGRLAGGVAHDFNNLLTAIMGYTQLLARHAGTGVAAQRDAEEILKAAERAALLTRQLLTFSRREMVQPRIFDLNALVADLGRMLRRLVGEDIDMVVAPTADRPAVQADPGQLEQVVMNLVVNARDAMPHGGRITIETSTVDIDEGLAGETLGLRSGAYVLLAVSDTGRGMDEATRARIFEPFFTTKEAGKGTGLGLSTVYGIVKQSGGAIDVYSDVGWGTTFKIYLPCAEGPVDKTGPAGTLEDAPCGTETVLIVEDQDAVAAVMRGALEACGYRILEARNGSDAVRLCAEPGEPIDLLVSDVVLPMISGPELVQRIRAIRPDIRVLFVSGYTERAVAHHDVPGGPVTGFLPKPFTPGALAWKVREVLDAARVPSI